MDTTTTTDAAVQDQLFAIEEGFWLKGEDFFLDLVDDQCLLAFPTMLDFHGVHSREEVAATATDPNRWREVKMTSRHLLQPAEDFAILSYRADATGADGKPYSTLIGSGYVRRSDGWKLAFHQHSPL
jgi:hypothetical protein